MDDKKFSKLIDLLDPAKELSAKYKDLDKATSRARNESDAAKAKATEAWNAVYDALMALSENSYDRAFGDSKLFKMLYQYKNMQADPANKAKSDDNPQA